MGRRHSIAAKKAAGDAKKSQNYAKIGKIIQIAAKKGADPKINPGLELALSKARQYGLPKDVIEKAILKGSGQLEWENLEEIFYEGYGTGGGAIYIKALTSNTNRTASNIKQTISKYGGTMGTPGSVSRQFQEKGVFLIDGTIQKTIEKGKPTNKIIFLNITKFENYILELPILDIEFENNKAIIYTSKNEFSYVQNQLLNNNYNIIESDIQYIPDNITNLNDEEKEQFNKLIDSLENDEDIDTIWHNT